MSVTHDDVRHVAALARLVFDEAATAAMADQLNTILGYVDLLQRAETGDVPATAHPFAEDAPMRDDTVEHSGLIEALLDNAPERDGRFVIVPRVIE